MEYYLDLIKRKDLYTYYHCIRVAYYSLIIGKMLNCSDEELEHIGKCALLHDIGKIYIPDDILKSKKSLSDEEFKKMKKHTVYSEIILFKDFPELINDIIMHHERLDGTGYPNQLKSISLTAQIIGIADSFDAMTSNRGYNNVKTFDEAFLELYDCSENRQLYNKNLVLKLEEGIKK